MIENKKIFYESMENNKLLKKPEEFLILDNFSLKEVEKKFSILKENIEFIPKDIIRFINIVIDKEIDVIFFLDKSARPSYLLFLKIWNHHFNNYFVPKVKFIEIGRVEFFDTYSKNYSLLNDYLNINQINKDEMIKRYGDLSDMNVLVADEYIDTGGTILLASKIFVQTFNPRKIYYTGIFEKLPAWYGKSDYLGVTENYKNRFSFLSRPNLNEKIRELRNELNLLSDIINQKTIKVSKDKLKINPRSYPGAYKIHRVRENRHFSLL